MPKSTKAEWQQFEEDVGKIFRGAGYEVFPNAKVAKPRQTDLFVKGDEGDFLVEAKSRKRAVDVNDVDALRSRLNRVSADIVGVIFSKSKITTGAAAAIVSDRVREVIVFNLEEIERLSGGAQDLKRLIERKRHELRVNSIVWFGDITRSEFLKVKLPRASTQFIVRKKRAAVFETKSSQGGLVFALRISDSGWGTLGGDGARLTVRPLLATLDDLRDLFGHLHQRFSLSRGGSFSIHQRACSWHGVGAEELFKELKDWRKRYEQSSQGSFHHSEVVRYFDSFRDGWAEISFNHKTNWERPAYKYPLHNSQLAIQMPGVPVNSTPFARLCQYLGDDWASFDYISERRTNLVRLTKPVKLNVVGMSVERNENLPADVYRAAVTGIIACNPFFGRDKLPKELVDYGGAQLHQLREIELLLCSLRDWHDERDVADYYELEGFEICEAGDGKVVRPFGTWNELTKV